MNLISEVKAQELTTEPNQEQFSFTSFVPLILIFVIFYFLIIRPQNKKMKEHKELVDNLKSGDKVITNSGIYGVIKSIDKKENTLEVEIAEDVNIKISKNYVLQVIAKDKKEKSATKNKKSKK